MATSVPAVRNGGLSPDKTGAAPSRTLSIMTTAVNHDSPSSVSSPASAASPSSVSTPTSSSSTAPPIAIRPSAAGKPLSAMAPAAVSRMTTPALVSPSSVSQARTLSMTSKEWVIPPRPKPGRKPATDTPPTKRKAQNRAAQRAFRERRAARVGELEEQLEEEKAAQERIVRELQERINHLELETQTLQSRCQWLESVLEKERQERDSMAANWNSPPVQVTRNDSLGTTQTHPQPSPAAVPQPMRPLQPAPSRDSVSRSITIAEPRPMAQPFSISHIVSPPEEGTEAVDLSCGGCQSNGSCACAEEVLGNANTPIGCGNCSLGTRCACLEETIRSMVGNDLKRPLPPSSPPSTSPEEKRQRSDAGLAMETDFTAMFSSQGNKDPAQSIFPPPAHSQLQPMASVEPRDSCGFCKDGTYCVCADSMMSNSLPAPANPQVAEHTQTHTPPPSEDDVVPMPMEVTATGAIKLPGLRSMQQQNRTNTQPKPPAKAGGGCGPNGPGTCAQCLVDPKSGLFCRSLAANFERNNPGASGGGCCGGGGPGGCCKTSGQSDAVPIPAQAPAPAGPAPAPVRPTPTNSGFGLSLSCADAYKTLASHRHFDEAADDIGSWLPKLRALPIPRPSGGAGGGGGAGAGGRGHGGNGRAPIEVEAASIMSVLKDFDVRFGRGE